MIDVETRYSGPDPQILPFPVEIFGRALSYLDTACDKKNARLVCKGFSEASLPSLTSTASFSTSLIEIGGSFEVPCYSSPTLEIALHPVVSKYITRLVCEGARFPIAYCELGAFQGWWATLRKKPYQMSWPIEEIHRMYTTRRAHESWIISKGEDQKIFRTALEHFLKLKCIVFTDVAADEQARDFPRPTWPPSVTEEDLWGLSSPYHSFAMCIRSLSEMAIKLQELHITGTRNAISNGIFARASPQDYNHLRNVFADLHKINVSVNLNQYPLTFGGLGWLLTRAKMLESLDLKCVGGNLHQSRLGLSQVTRDFRWPQLKHFGLNGFTMRTDAELIAFLDRHQATLNSVSLRSMFMHEKDWESTDHSPCEAWKHLFGELRNRSISFQSLYVFRIHDCYNCVGDYPDLAVRVNGGEGLLRYLRDGGPNPLASDSVSYDSEY